MGEAGKRDKRQKEQRKRPKLTIKEKRKLKKNKNFRFVSIHLRVIRSAILLKNKMVRVKIKHSTTNLFAIFLLPTHGYMTNLLE